MALFTAMALLMTTMASAAVVDETAVQAAAACIALVGPAKDKPLRDATFAIYTQCRLEDQRRGLVEPSCRELARLYSVARHYSDAGGGKLATEDFCETTVGSASEQGAMQEVDACVAGAEEVLASKEVSEAAEAACRRSHPKSAQAPEACRRYVASLSEALHRAPAGELVDAESICGQLVGKSSTIVQRQPAVLVSSAAADKVDVDQRKFVTSCVQFAGSLMNAKDIGEEDVRKTCEAHLPSEEKFFCSGYARLVNQKADATDISNFCVAEYSRMSIKTPAAERPVVATKVQQPKQHTSMMAMSMPALCARLFDKAVSASVSGPELKKEAAALCTQELSQLAHRPPPARIRVGCNFFGGRLAKMKEEQGAATTTADAFCARIAKPAHSTSAPHVAAPSVSKLVAAVPPTPVQQAQAPVAVVSRSAPIQQHSPAALTPTPIVNKASNAAGEKQVQLAASAALPALAAAAAVVPVPADPQQDAAKVKSDEDFLNKFLNKYETNTAKVPVATAATIAMEQPPKLTVLGDDEMAEVRRKAEQLFGDDAAPAAAAAAAAASVGPVALPPPMPAAPPVTPVAATPPAAPVAAVAGKKPTAMLSVDNSLLSEQEADNVGSKDAAVFLSGFLNEYTGNHDNDNVAAQSPPPAAPVPVPVPEPVQQAVAVQSQQPVLPLALLAEVPPIDTDADDKMSGDDTDVGSLVTSFLARN